MTPSFLILLVILTAAAATVNSEVPVSEEITCNFDDNSACGWTNDENAELPWTLSKGTATPNNSGPAQDVSGSGYFISVNSLGAQEGGIALLNSPIINATLATKSHCIQFYYHLYGDRIEEVNLNVVSPSGNILKNPWRRDKQQGYIWLRAHVTLNKLDDNSPYGLSFEALVGNGLHGDIGIDEIVFTPNRQCQPIAEISDLVGHYCDFETPESCAYNIPSPWRITKPQVGPFLYPKFDNTYRTSEGYFLQFRPKLESPGTSKVVTPEFDANQTGRCLQFYTYSYNQYAGTLKVKVKADNKETDLFTPSRSMSTDNWIQNEFPVPETYQNFSIVFEGSLSVTLVTGYLEIGIDDVSLRKGSCRLHPGDCNFDIPSMCSWSNYKENEHDWLLYKSGPLPWPHLPTADITMGSPDGGFLVFETSQPKQTNDKSWLVSEVFQYSKKPGVCFSFWYQMIGDSVGALRLYFAYTLETRQPMWELLGPQLPMHGDWLRGVMPIVAFDKDFFIVIEAEVGHSGKDGFIALDGLEFSDDLSKCIRFPVASEPGMTTQAPSTSKPPVPAGFACDFETDLCGWKQTDESTGDWILKKAGNGLGPSIDHSTTSDKGQYLYFESFFNEMSEVNFSEEAVLVSPKIFNGASQCLEFWYHMTGSRVGRLSVYVFVSTQGVLEQSRDPLWHRDTDGGNHWRLAKVNYQGGNVSVTNFLIEAFASSKSSGNIAIDDTNLVYGSCEPADFAQVSCSFEEEHICAYEFDSRADFFWKRHKGATPTSGTGPSVDVTEGTAEGYYMYIEATSQLEGEVARLVSPVQNLTTGKCLSFFYHAYGPNIGTLNVMAKLNATSSPVSNLWSMSGNQEDHWYLARTPTDFKFDFQVIFEGIVGKGGGKGDIAIDDVVMSSTGCPRPENCDFESAESPMCSWISQNNDMDFNWYVPSEEENFDNDFASDHTLGSPHGHFLMAKSASANQQARLLSQLLPPTSDNGACLTFYYYFSLASGMKLDIYIQDNNQQITKYWSLTDGQVSLKAWNLGRIAFRTDSQYKILIDATTGNVPENYIGLDDFDFSYGLCESTPNFAVQVWETTAMSTTETTTRSPLDDYLRDFDCDFEAPCKWNISSWNIMTAQDGHDSLGGPVKDNTLKSPAGSYLVADIKNVSNWNNVASLESGKLNRTKCIGFYYYMYGEETGLLNVWAHTRSTGSSSSSSKILSKDDHSQPMWLFVQSHHAPRVATNTYVIGIELVQRSRPLSGFIALDDIVVHDGYCVNTALCTFESPDICSYTNDATSDYQWNRATGADLSANYPDLVDHTLETNLGNFMFVDLQHAFESRTATLISPSFEKTPGSCVHFFVLNKDNDNYELSLYQQVDNDLVSMNWYLNGSIGEGWQEVQADIPSSSSKPWNLVIKAQKGSNVGDQPKGILAIDDVRITRGFCPNQGDCNFEDGSLCEYRNINSEEMSWLVRTGPSPNSPETGPDYDHTLFPLNNEGYYLVTDTKDPILTGQRAQIQSEIFLGSSASTCVTFWYSMKTKNKPTMGTLNVIRHDLANKRFETMWTMSLGQDTVWNEAKLTYTADYRHTIIFEAVKGQGVGDIALDDIVFFADSTCAFKPTNATPPESTTTPQITSTTARTIFTWDQETEYDCNFEGDFCGWQQDPTADFKWTRKAGPAAAPSVISQTGPTTDHTLQTSTGYYIYIDTANNPLDRKARIQTQLIDPTVSKCLEFFYHAFGVDVKSLNVYLKQSDQLGAPVWTRNRNQGNQWLKGQVRIRNPDKPYQVVFEGVSGGFYGGIIALDDIRIAAQCAPASDRFCDFESEDICNYTIADSAVKWVRRKASGTPWVDHTTDSADGYVMTVSGKSQKTEIRSQLVSNMVLTANDQCLQFYYYQPYMSVGGLNVYFKFSDENSSSLLPVWTEKKLKQGDDWHIAQVPLGHILSPHLYQAIFEQYVEPTQFATDFSTSIDDVLFRDESCLPHGDCDFEHGFYTWYAQWGVGFQWLLDNSLNQDPSRPLVDQTLGTSSGSYAYVQTTGTPASIDAFLISDVFPPTSYKGRCMTFYYYVQADSFDLQIILEILNERPQRGPMSTVWRLTEANAEKGQWAYASLGLHTTGDYMLAFQALITSATGSLAIDDISFKESQFCSATPASAEVEQGGTTPSQTTTKMSTTTQTPSQFDCDFEADFCAWSNDETKPIRWKRNQGGTFSFASGPQADHTLGTQDGWYIYMDASEPASPKDAAHLVSPGLQAGPKCLTFWYHMKGKHIDALNVLTTNYTNISSIWSRKGNQGSTWKLATVNFEPDQSNTITFEAVRGSGYEGDISLDDIKLKEGFCEPNDYFKCDFETTDLCGFQNETNGGVSWQRLKGKKYTALNSGPWVDATTNSASGHYMAIDSTSTHQKGDRAALVSKQFDITPEGNCLTWYYHMWGADMGTLTVYVKVEDRTKILWRFDANLGDIWNVARVDVPYFATYKKFTLVFECVMQGNGRNAFMAIDDIQLDLGLCPSFGSCSFEDEDSCGWKNVFDDRDEFDWTFGSLKSSAFDTGPSFDHTLQDANGIYMYADAEFPNQPGNRAVLESTNFLPTPSYGQCLEFWYNMYGDSGMGILNVHVNVSGTLSLLWTQSGHQGTAWRFGQVTVRSTQAYRLSFQAVRGNSFASNIAIDDIDFVEKACQIRPDNADPSNQVTIPVQTTTRSLRPTSRFDCDFEQNMCIWISVPDVEIQWIRTQGITGSQVSGPLAVDHSLGSAQGWYLVADISRPGQHGQAVLLSTQMESRKCMTFYYYFAANSKFEFIVYAVASDHQRYDLWQKTSSVGGFWRLGRVSVALPKLYAIKIELDYQSSGASSDIFALDDIFFADGDCIENSDINNLCSFSDAGICGYKVNASTASRFMWTHNLNDTDPEGPANGPILIGDHTSELVGGGYMFAYANYALANDTTTLTSPVYIYSKLDAPVRCVEFYYYLQTSNRELQLNVLAKLTTSSNNRYLLWTRDSNHENYWWKGEATVKFPANYSILFEAQTWAANRNGVVGLDDIIVKQGACSRNTYECTFDSKDFCNWINEPAADELDWKLNNGLISGQTGPSADHTTGSGYYAFLSSSSPAKPGWRAQLVSEPFDDPSIGCLNIWYTMFGINIGSINIYLVTGSSKTMIWTLFRDQGKNWQHGTIQFQSDKEHQIMIEGVVGDVRYSDIAIDDISIVRGQECKPTPFNAVPEVQIRDSIECSFEGTLCLWKNVANNSQFMWNFNSNVSAPQDRRPTHGAIYTNDYLFITTPTANRDQRARLQSTPIPAVTTDTICLQFYTITSNEKFGSFYILIDSVNGTRVDSSTVGIRDLTTSNATDLWHVRTFEILTQRLKTNSILTIDFSVEIFENKDEYIGLDEITLTVGQCPTSYMKPINCDFETDFCDWKVVHWNQSIEWARVQGRVTNSGPPGDYTSGAGYYIFVDMTQSVANVTAAIETETTLPGTPSSGYCFSFFYHQYGSSVGTLNVWQISSLGKRIIWTRSRSQSNQWRQAKFNLVSDVAYKLKIEAVTKEKSFSREIIALDDILISPEPCDQSFVCDFETDFCYFENVVAPNYYPWLRGITQDFGTAPVSDHTTGTRYGHYLYTSVTNQELSRHVVKSKPLRSNIDRCMRFWYHMFDVEIGTLSVYRRFANSTALDILWTKSGSQDNLWRMASVSLGKTKTVDDYSINFEGVTGKSVKSIAIDDISAIEGATCGPAYLCDFEEDFCSWTNAENDHDDDIDWLRYAGRMPQTNTGPAVDVTLGTEFGHYILLDPFQSREDLKAWLVSEHFLPKLSPNGEFCVKFYYHMLGQRVESLNVYTRVGSSAPELQWTRKGNKGDVWLTDSFIIKPIAEFVVIFEGYTTFFGDIALDDISVTPGSCEMTTTDPSVTVTYPKAPIDCDFEVDFCAWKNDQDGGSIVWQRNYGPTVADFTGPLVDHTLQSLLGHYIYIKSSAILGSDQVARLVSLPVTVKKGGFCFKFWFHMYGQAINTLRIKQSTPDLKNETVIWTRSKSQGNEWNYGQVKVTDIGEYKFVIEGLSARLKGDIAVDDVSGNDGDCPPTTYCDFESEDLCGFNDAPLFPKGDFQWLRNSGSTSTTGTGPSYDHTTLNSHGHYMYLESSPPRVETDKAYLVSPFYKFNKTSTKCIEFWYHAYGEDIGTLNVYKLLPNGISFLSELLYTTSGEQGEEWHIAQANLNVPQNKEFNIVFEGTLHAGINELVFYGDMAIDDYRLYDFACQPLGSCDFEENTCSWKNAEKEVDFNWVRMRGSTPSNGTGPSVDHTLGTPYGTYLFLDLQPPLKEGYKARLVSPVFSRRSPLCLEFYYHMLGHGESTLNVIKKGFKNLNNGTVVWSQNSTMEDTWHPVAISLPFESSSPNFHLIFEGVVGASTYGDIALDDIVVSNNTVCKTPDEACKFTCNNGACLSADKVCNFVNDCPDGEEEESCGYNHVTFENDTKGWTADEDGALKWQRKRSGLDNYEPDKDHTLGTNEGYYLQVATGTGLVDKNAFLTSPVLKNSIATCRLTFWYQIQGQNYGGIDVDIKVGNERFSTLRLRTATTANWFPADLLIGRYKSDLTLSIEGTRQSVTRTGYVAIDDIEFTGCQNPPRACNALTEFSCRNGACIDPSQLCDFTDDCGDLSDETVTVCHDFPVQLNCDFESSFCIWAQDENNEYNWRRTNGLQPNPDYYPSRDHSTNNLGGYYAYFDTKGKKAGARSALIGPTLYNKGEDKCSIRFYYHSFGKSVGKLAVYTRKQVGGAYSAIWSLEGSADANWNRADVTVKFTSWFLFERLQLILEATAASNTLEDGIIAIDDISFSEGCRLSNESLPVIPVTTTAPPLCGNNGFQCSDMKCIKLSEVCDFKSDCPDGGDEAYCGTCTFEDHECGWYDNSFGDHFWNRTRASESYLPSDHTTGKPQGYLMSFKTRFSTAVGLTRLYTPKLQGSHSHCELSFYYYANLGSGAKMSFGVYVQDPEAENNEIDQLYVTTTFEQKLWVKKTLVIGERPVNFAVYFEAIMLGPDKPLFAIDDTSFSNCGLSATVPCDQANVFKCNNTLCIPSEDVCDFSNDCGDNSDEDEAICSKYTRCDFEDDANPLCNWNLDDDADFYWQRAQGKEFEATFFSYPWDDHTTETTSGHYLYVPDTGAMGIKCRLSSPVFYPTSSDSCVLRLWYNSKEFSNEPVSLLVYTRTQLGGKLNLLWERKGAWVGGWRLINVPIKGITSLFQVVIEGEQFFSAVAIDDISLTPECVVNPFDPMPIAIFPTPAPDASCSAQFGNNGTDYFKCDSNPSKCVPMSDLCNFRPDCQDATDESFCPSACTFEGNSICNWMNEVKPPGSQPKISWQVVQGAGVLNPANPERPNIDHTTTSPQGYYLNMNPIDKQPGDLARFMSPVYNQAGQTCSFELWYQMAGDKARLNVYIKADLVENLLVSIAEPKPKSWTRLTAQLPHCVSQFQIVIEGVRGDYNTMLAVDDLKLIDCEYPKPPEPPTCSSNQHQCSITKHCVDMSVTCDYNRDCCDGSDEFGQLCQLFYRCNFENDMCNFVHLNETKFHWTRVRSDAQIAGVKPMSDHTIQLSNGHYMLFKYPDAMMTGDNAAFALNLASARQYCQMRFWFMKDSDNIGELHVKMRESIGGEFTLLKTFTSVSKAWTREQVYIPARLTALQIVIEGVLGVNRDGYIAIDDVSLTEECLWQNAGTIPPSQAPSTTTTTTASTSTTTTTTTPTTTTTTPSTTTTTTTTSTTPSSSTTTTTTTPPSSSSISTPTTTTTTGSSSSSTTPETTTTTTPTTTTTTTTTTASSSSSSQTTPEPATTTTSRTTVKIPTCPPDYCKNGGTCRALGEENYECLCRTRYSGKYCEVFEGKPEPKKHSDAGLIVGVTIGGLVVIALLGALVYRLKRGVKANNYQSMIDDQVVNGTSGVIESYKNPIFDLEDTDELESKTVVTKTDKSYSSTQRKDQ